MGRRPINQVAMTDAERQERSRDQRAAAIHAEANYAADLLAEALRLAPRMTSTKIVTDNIVDALNALDRLRNLVRR